MTTEFTSKPTRNLIDLRGNLLKTLSNQKCEPIFEPVTNTIRIINIELESRGIKSLLKSKQ